ncbi:DUF4181 domain-containing protein [Halobacillus salinus]|uniref:DUF4181 domain-containing protein n=1 Tax=Halobacillus salinus TaxID=192814 RepID=A0A4Z0GZF2_9BACI|nr:DUF4181 domain-containing protein [Halobacillus salinus]TGB03583.1 DUF4181 domain-containing protein [Halobacillus salinus]
MFWYWLEPAFWLRLAIVIAVVLLLLYSFHAIMSKWLKVERGNFFSNNYVNEKHKKVDWIIRVAAIISIMIGFAINSSTDPYWFFEPWAILSIYIVASLIGRAVMERKYAQNPNAFKVTVSDLVFVLVLFFTLMQTDVLGLV